MNYSSRNHIALVTANLSDRLFDEEEIYSTLENFLKEHALDQSLQLLPYVKKMHGEQVRSGKDQIPFYSHPIHVALHAAALGFTDDTVISAALLHDICEDCEILPEELPASPDTRTAVSVLTKESIKKPSPDASEAEWLQYYHREEVRNDAYYNGLRRNKTASIVKLLDRCNNVSGMSSAWNHEKLAEYIHETERWIYPLLDYLKETCPEYSSQLFLIAYHMRSVVEAVRHLIADHSI